MEIYILRNSAHHTLWRDLNMTKRIKEPGSAITHFIGMLMAICAAIPLLHRAVDAEGRIYVVALAVFAISAVMLYAASSTYHTVISTERINTALKKLDHMMIYVLIAGTYTPVCLLVLGGNVGYVLLAVIWGIAALGILFKAFWVYCPKWVSSVFYIGMGWACIMTMPQLLVSMTSAQFAWLLAGGILYTVGGVIYALRLKSFNERHKNFGSHEIFHLFVMGGSACHFVLMYLLV